MSFFDAYSEMLVILFAILAGYGAHHLGYLGGEVDQKICKVILNITMPAMIVAAVITGDTLPDLAEVLSILKVAVVFYALEFAMVLVVPRFLGGTPKQLGVWRYVLSFPNVGFIGYPVAVALFGQEALFYAVVLALPFNLLSYTLGPLMLAGVGKFSWKKSVSPCAAAAVISLVLALTRVRVPSMIGECLDFVGDITVPLSLLVVGSLLAGLPAKQVFSSPRLWILSALRLLALPVILCFILRAVGVDAMILGVAVTQMAMPVAVNGTMLSMEYGGDTGSMAQITFLSTLLSIVTIPLIAAFLL